MTHRRGRTRRHGARRRTFPATTDAASQGEAAERRGTATAGRDRGGSSAGRGLGIVGVGMWLAWMFSLVGALRLDPLLGPSSAKRLFSPPGDWFGDWIDAWTAGPYYPLARVAARLLVVGPLLAGIGYELYRRRARPAGPWSQASEAEGGVDMGAGVGDDEVPVAQAREPGRVGWIALGAAVVGVAVLDGWYGAAQRTGALWIGVTFIVALNVAGWMSARRHGAKPRGGPPRMGNGTEAQP